VQSKRIDLREVK